ncbi:NUDIX domain protein [Penicillium riverlandense]|uniref:NUDIX domain protein n=1 Tax=Penicillium riverlandense TaxID=1903569 RepID=UPI0025471EB7|nr:NUDIX domain protein [Penicillium riverlandense]KAJ5820150.1 NUDIX domain protein [Penicillium riverlandense]
MAHDYFPIVTESGICQVAKRLEKLYLNQPWVSYLKHLKEDPSDSNDTHKISGMKDMDKVSGISVRGWICDWEGEKVKVLLGQRARTDSSPGLHEAFGGKCDPGESIPGALVREFREETGQDILCIEAFLGGEIFLTPTSKRWIVQLHFLVQVQRSGDSPAFDIQLRPEEHQAYLWASENLDALNSIQLTNATKRHFESAVTAFRGRPKVIVKT